MICSKCGMEVQEGIKFCTVCGNRLDKKIECPKCHAENEETAKFCKTCGKLLVEKKCCSKCNTELTKDSLFCPNCGEKYDSMPIKIKKARSNEGFTKVEKILSPSLLLFGLFFITICSLFMGYTIKGTGPMGDIIGSLIGSNDSKHNVMYFFGGVYRDLYATYGITSLSELYFSAGIPLVILTVTFACNIILSLTMLTIGSIKYGKAMVKKEEICLGKYFAWALAGFLLSLALMLSCGVNLEMVYVAGLEKTSIVLKTVPNLIAVFGIIVSIFVGLSVFVLKLVVESMEDFDIKRLLGKIFASFIVVFSIVSLFSFAKNFIYSNVVLEKVLTVRLGIGALCLSTTVGELNLYRYNEYRKLKDKGEKPNLELLVENEVIMQAIVFVVLALLLVILIAFATNSILEKKQFRVMMIIFSTICAAGAIAAMIIVDFLTVDLSTIIYEGINITRGAISGLVFSIMSLILSIVCISVKPKNELE